MTSVLAVIAARGGSRGVPGKNIRPLGGRPLIAWTVEAATRARTVTRTLVTTDDESIAAAARTAGAETPFMRPAELARDDTPGTDPVLHAVQWLADHERYVPDVVVLLQPTSPFRTAGDVDDAVNLLFTRKADAVVSVTEAHPHPYWMKRMDADGWLHDLIELEHPVARRQDLPPVYMLNGAIYAARHDTLMSSRGWYGGRTAALVMPADRSIDIDTLEDFERAEREAARRS